MSELVPDKFTVDGTLNIRIEKDSLILLTVAIIIIIIIFLFMQHYINRAT